MWWIFLIFISLGILQHDTNEESIKKTTLELLQDNGYSEVKIEDIHLPISYTVFSEKVVSEVFIINNKKRYTINVTVTPIGGTPIISIFDPPAYRIHLNPLLNLKELFRSLLTE